MNALLDRRAKDLNLTGSRLLKELNQEGFVYNTRGAVFGVKVVGFKWFVEEVEVKRLGINEWKEYAGIRKAG